MHRGALLGGVDARTRVRLRLEQDLLCFFLEAGPAGVYAVHVCAWPHKRTHTQRDPAPRAGARVPGPAHARPEA